MKKDLRKPCQPYIEGERLLWIEGISVVVFGVVVISIIPDLLDIQVILPGTRPLEGPCVTRLVGIDC